MSECVDYGTGQGIMRREEEILRVVRTHVSSEEQEREGWSWGEGTSWRGECMEEKGEGMKIQCNDLCVKTHDDIHHSYANLKSNFKKKKEIMTFTGKLI